MMDTWRVELEKHFLLNSDWCDTHVKVKAPIRDGVEQLHYQADPV